MYSRVKIFSTRQLVSQLGGLVYEHGQVLGANPIDIPLVLDLQEWHLGMVAFTVNASGLIGCHIKLHCLR